MKKRHGVLGFLVSLSVITFLDRLAIAVAGPRIQDELRIPPEKWGWVLGAFALAYGIFEIPSGASGDRLGQRRVLSRIVVWWSAFTAATAAAASFAQLVVTQFLFGAGEAGAYPNASGVIARWFPKAERARAQGAVWAASRIGGALSPLLVVPLLHAVGWRGMFCVFAGLGLIWSALWRTWFHDRPADHPGITEAELSEIGGGSPPAHGAGLWRALLRSRQTWLLAAMYWCYVWGSWFYFSWFPTFLVRGAGFTEKEMGLLSALPFVLGCAGNLGGGWLSDRLAARYGLKVARCGQASASLAASSLLIFGLAFAKEKALVIALASLGFGVLDLMLPAAWSLCLDLGRKHAGVLAGTMNSAGLAGGFACTVLFGYLVRMTGGYRAPLCAIAFMVMVSAVLFALIDPYRAVWKEES
ncbi:MAG TPA: MFS transporter [Candidatus Sulfopaludibacter sp.]|nr:MFS transporter [Candidatus Sulfopaludibacter sp.]